MKIKAKVAFLLFALGLFLSIGAIFISYQVYTESMLTHYMKNASALSDTVAFTLKKYELGEMVDRILKIHSQLCKENGGKPVDFSQMTENEIAKYLSAYDEITETTAYQNLQKDMKELNEINDAISVYFVAYDSQNEICVYVVDGSNPEETIVCPCGYFEQIDEEELKKLKAGELSFEPFDSDFPEYGWLCTAATAVLSDENEFLGISEVDISMNEVQNDRIQFLIRLALVSFIFTLLLVAVALYATNKTLVMPLKELSNATKNFVAEKNTDGENALLQLDIHTKDEVEELYDSFVKMNQELNKYIDDLVEMTAENEKLGVELNLAKTIQASVLPCIFPPFPDRHEFEIYAMMNPAKEVGGDFYDFFLIDDDHLALIIADVSGKGVPAALFMMISKTLIKSQTQARREMKPAEILQAVNLQLCENNKADMFVTVWLGIVEISTGKLISANAGHEYPTIKRADGDFELIKDKHGLPLASMEIAKYKEYETVVYPGDVIFVYTDGVAEATNKEMELYGTARMLTALNRVKDQECEVILKSLTEDIDQFVKEAPQFDDITMLAIKYKGV